MTVAEETEAALVTAGAILGDDHFVYISGDHGRGWGDKDAVFPDTGQSTRQTVAAVEGAGGIVVGADFLAARGAASP